MLGVGHDSTGGSDFPRLVRKGLLLGGWCKMDLFKDHQARPGLHKASRDFTVVLHLGFTRQSGASTPGKELARLYETRDLHFSLA